MLIDSVSKITGRYRYRFRFRFFIASLLGQMPLHSHINKTHAKVLPFFKILRTYAWKMTPLSWFRTGIRASHLKNTPFSQKWLWAWMCTLIESDGSGIFTFVVATLGPVLLTLLRHVARILANGRAAFFESCDAIGWNSCDVSQKR